MLDQHTLTSNDFEFQMHADTWKSICDKQVQSLLEAAHCVLHPPPKAKHIHLGVLPHLISDPQSAPNANSTENLK